MAYAAVAVVRPGSPIEKVVAILPTQRVIPGFTEEAPKETHIVSIVAADNVADVLTLDEISIVAAVVSVGPVLAPHEVIAGASIRDIRPIATVDPIDTVLAQKLVTTWASINKVVPPPASTSSFPSPPQIVSSPEKP